MKDDGLILTAWGEAEKTETPAILATVVKVAGSSYRSPGARMLITENGGRTGSISGGCLEGDVLKKAWWLTGDSGAAVRVYDSTSDDEAVWAFGLGCNGVVHVLLERWEAGSAPLTAELLRACQESRDGAVLATVISGDRTGQKLALFPNNTVRAEMDENLANEAEPDARRVLETRESELAVYGDTEVFLEFLAPPVRLIIAGAGQDALPLVRFAKELGWHVTVTDGRSNQARPERFPRADRVLVANLEDAASGLNPDAQSAAVLMSHSYPQDLAFLKALYGSPLAYLGVLGPRKRTERMLAEAGLTAVENLYSPVGLDIGADTPDEIALAIVSEIRAVLAARSGGMLRSKPGPIHEERQLPVAAQQPVPA